MRMEIVRAPWWCKKKHYVRRRPRNFDEPSPAQLEGRIRFAEASTRQFGRRGIAPSGLPVVAANVSRQLKGMSPIRKTRVELGAEVRAALEAEMRRRGIEGVTLPKKYVFSTGAITSRGISGSRERTALDSQAFERVRREAFAASSAPS